MSYNERAKCPMWLKFLNEIMDGNTRLIDFLQRAIGYSLTGLTTEQLFLILWGIGANGKSVFSETILGMLGEDYARNAQAKTILTRDGRGDSGINNDLARLRGIRFVTVNEIPGRGRLDEAKVKELTGTDTITARFLFHEPFQFQPPFKIWIRTNHKPIITGTDPGIWRRVRLVPFNVSIPPEEQDKHLIEKLRDEYPGIMAWAVMGCLTWLDEGLTFPDEVRAATAEYKADSDTFQPFLEECCIIDKTATTTAASLYEKYKEWATTNNERPMTKNMFGRELSERGFDKFRPGTTGPTTYSGIGLAGDK
jgi:putative DNA primase/helicase